MAAKSLTYIKPLDGLRALAILLVIVHHYFALLIPVYTPFAGAIWFKIIFSISWSGVDLFFLLSGFLIGRILIIQKGSAQYFSQFYVRRAFRILPAYLLLLTFFVLFLQTGWYAVSPWLFSGAFPWYSYGLFIQNFWAASSGHYGANWLAPTWSLAVEEQFYLLLPLLIYLLPIRKLPLLLIVAIVAAPIIRLNAPDITAYVLLPCRMDALFMGVLIAWVYLQGGLGKGKINSRRLAWAIMLLLFLIYTYIALTQASMGDAWLHSMLTIFYGCLLIFAIANAENLHVNRLLGNKAVRFIAHISYSLYIWHQVINGLVHAWFKNEEPRMQTGYDVALAMMGIALTVLVATVSYYFIERPLLRFAKKDHFKWKAKQESGV